MLHKATNQEQVYLGELAAGGTHMNPPRRLTNDEAFDEPMAWTPDSKAVLFESNRNGTWGIFKQGISQDTAEPVVTGPQDVGFRASAPMAPGYSTRSLRRQPLPLHSAPPDAHPCGRWSASVGAGDAELAAHGCARAPASLCVIVEASQDQKQLTAYGIRSL